MNIEMFTSRLRSHHMIEILPRQDDGIPDVVEKSGVVGPGVKTAGVNLEIGCVYRLNGRLLMAHGGSGHVQEGEYVGAPYDGLHEAGV